MSSTKSLPPRAADPDFASLIRESADGNGDALSTLYDASKRHVYGLALRIVGDPAEAEEVTLDVYAQVWRQASRYDPARGNAIAWLLMLARSRAIDRLRSRAAVKANERAFEPNFELSDPADDPEAKSSLGQRSRLVRRALADLSDEQREAIDLAFFEGLTHSEISSRLAQPLGTTKTRIRLGLARLREALGPLSARRAS